MKKTYFDLEKENNVKFICAAVTKSERRLQEVNAYLKDNNVNMSIYTKRRHSKETTVQNMGLTLETAIMISNSLNEVFKNIPNEHIIKANNRLNKSNYKATLKLFQ